MVIETLLVCSLIAVLLPITVVASECLLASFASASKSANAAVASDRPSLAVLIPAHNEEAGIAQTLAAIVPQLRQGDRVLVVADNCADRTADVARSAGAEVIERVDHEKRGKGYALDAGIRHLAANPPGILLVVDADCDCRPGSLAELASGVVRTGCPQQAVYLMETPSDPSPASCVSAFAFRVKNKVRPLGLHRLGLPCLLTGTGMAFPWAAISGAALASGNIVEDMQLGLDLAIAGHAPRLCPTATVMGRLPAQVATADTQRTRWEHGHLQTMLTQVPRLIGRGIVGCSPRLLGLALELAVPPLSLLVLTWIGATAIVIPAWLVAGWRLPATIAALGWLCLFASIGSAWWRFARDILPFRTVVFIPVYMLGKIPRFLAFLTRRQREWVRTARETPAGGSHE